MKTETLSSPVTVSLPGYSSDYIVTGVERRKNHGPLLTLAIATFRITPTSREVAASDIVTRMRLADATSDLHSFPVNADTLYGPRGRQSNVARVA